MITLSWYFVMYIIVEPLCCTLETSMILYVNYTSMKEENLQKQKKEPRILYMCQNILFGSSVYGWNQFSKLLVNHLIPAFCTGNNDIVILEFFTVMH